MISIVVLSGLVYLTYYGNTVFSKLDIEDFEIGMVADRDITAGKNIYRRKGDGNTQHGRTAFGFCRVR